MNVFISHVIFIHIDQASDGVRSSVKATIRLHHSEIKTTKKVAGKREMVKKGAPKLLHILIVQYCKHIIELLLRWKI